MVKSVSSKGKHPPLCQPSLVNRLLRNTPGTPLPSTRGSGHSILHPGSVSSPWVSKFPSHLSSAAGRCGGCTPRRHKRILIRGQRAANRSPDYPADPAKPERILPSKGKGSILCKNVMLESLQVVHRSPKMVLVFL